MARSWKWDCPSCGADKRRALVEMGAAADARRIITLTLLQPGAINPDGDFYEPQEFLSCDPETHCYVYKDGSLRWLTRPDCRHCLQRVSVMLVKWRKRLRRVYGHVELLRVYEKHKSGGLHIHVLVTGLPVNLSRSSEAGQLVKAMWSEVGGGWSDLGRHGKGGDGARKAAGYASKYVTKAAGVALARGYRSWTRTRGFSPQIKCPGSSVALIGPVCGPFRPQTVIGGWVNLERLMIVATRELAGVAASPT